MGGPQPSALLGPLDHVGLSVPDLEEAVRFFVGHIGAEELFRLGRPASPSRGAERLGAPVEAQFALAMLQVGRGRLELVQWWPPGDDGTWPSPSQAGAPHVALEVRDVAVALESLRHVEGVAVMGEPVHFPQGQSPGLVNAFVKAPWGLLIELVHWVGV
jgi:catechol 2,3-dioxygenase-like lactoylglutathione lyase family enzyme